MYKNIGRINKKLLANEYGEITTDEVILMDERAEHVRLRHSDDYSRFVDSLGYVVSNPDEIIKDANRKGTVFYVKHLKKDNLSVVVRLSLITDKSNRKNSIITFHRVRDSYLRRLEQKNKVIYKKMD